MDYFFIVYHSWLDANGNPGVQGFLYKEEAGQLPALARAKSKYHDILMRGAVSNDQYVASVVYRNDGSMECPLEYFDRREVE